jgi:protein subunit release factor B
MSGAVQTAQQRLRELGWDASEVNERFARSSGPGGQHVNKVSTAVTLRHDPTGVSVTVQESRSQHRNRELAWIRIVELLHERARAARAVQRSARELERRRRSPRPPALKRRMRELKEHRGQTKQARRRVQE